MAQLLRDLDLPITLLFGETWRESHGLAMSSRNEYLSPTTRDLASVISRELSLSKERILTGEPAETVLQDARNTLENSGFKVDYFDLIDVDAFRPVTERQGLNAIIAAVKAETTRLIDNILLFSSSYMS